MASPVWYSDFMGIRTRGRPRKHDCFRDQLGWLTSSSGQWKGQPLGAAEGFCSPKQVHRSCLRWIRFYEIEGHAYVGQVP